MVEVELYAWTEITFKKNRDEISLIAKRTSLNPMLGVYLYVAAESRTIQAPVYILPFTIYRIVNTNKANGKTPLYYGIRGFRGFRNTRIQKGMEVEIDNNTKIIFIQDSRENKGTDFYIVTKHIVKCMCAKD
ncbi:hypothetical protein J7L13_01185, partial [bacterium]|nr:hypothetical protein [bacterium]